MFRGKRLTMMKLFNQFEQVESDTPFARREVGNISARTINKRLQKGDSDEELT